MQPENVRSAADARKIVEERKLEHIKVGVFDNDGVMRGKYMGRDKFFSALDKGFGFCDVVLGWDSNDQLYDNVKYTGWHTAYLMHRSACCPIPVATFLSKATWSCSSASSPRKPKRSARAPRCDGCSRRPTTSATR